MSARQLRGSPKKRFAVGAEVRVKMPGLNGTITRSDPSPTAMGEYWHTVRTEHGERKEPGSNLELIPLPVTNAQSKELTRAVADQKLSSSDAIKRLCDVEEMLNKKQQHLESQIQEEKKTAIRCSKQGNKRGALMALKRKKKL